MSGDKLTGFALLAFSALKISCFLIRVELPARLFTASGSSSSGSQTSDKPREVILTYCSQRAADKQLVFSFSTR